MNLLIISIVFAIAYTLYALCIYIKSEVLQIKRIESSDVSIEKIKMNQYFHFK